MTNPDSIEDPGIVQYPYGINDLLTGLQGPY